MAVNWVVISRYWTYSCVYVIRAVKLTAKYLTPTKRRRYDALLEANRAAVQHFINSLWAMPGRLDAVTLRRLPLDRTRLSYSQRKCALRQALGIITATRTSSKATGRGASKPVFRGGMTLCEETLRTKANTGVFDLLVIVTSLNKGNKLVIPAKRTAMLIKWLAVPGAKLRPGGMLTRDGIILWVEVPEPAEKTVGGSVGLDVGVRKLVSLSDGRHLGTHFRAIRDKVARRKNGSAGKRSAMRHRDNYIGQVVNQIPFEALKMIAIEDLTGISKGKKKGQTRSFRRVMAPWAYRQVRQRIEQKARQHGVRVVAVDPRDTSRRCPRCGTVSAKNRVAEVFHCVGCGHHSDADTVGAVNILAKAMRFIGSVEPPVLTKVTADAS
jgi:IS605 OrfB family transposase